MQGSPRWIGRTVLPVCQGDPVACYGQPDPWQSPGPCPDEWVQWVDARVGTGDGQGPGRDDGALEWRQGVLFRPGLQDQPAQQTVESAQWCQAGDPRARAICRNQAAGN